MLKFDLSALILDKEKKQGLVLVHITSWSKSKLGKIMRSVITEAFVRNDDPFNRSLIPISATVTNIFFALVLAFCFYYDLKRRKINFQLINYDAFLNL